MVAVRVNTRGGFGFAYLTKINSLSKASPSCTTLDPRSGPIPLRGTRFEGKGRGTFMQPITSEEQLNTELLAAGMFPPDDKNPRCVICGTRKMYDYHRSDDNTAVYVCDGWCWAEFVATDIYKAANPGEPTPEQDALTVALYVLENPEFDATHESASRDDLVKPSVAYLAAYRISLVLD